MYVSVVLPVSLLNSAAALTLTGSAFVSMPLSALLGAIREIEIVVFVLCLECSAKRDGATENARLVLAGI